MARADGTKGTRGKAAGQRGAGGAAPVAVRGCSRARAHYHHLAELIHDLEFRLHGRIEESGLIPDEWDEIAKSRGPMPKQRLCLWVEGDVVKFFKGMGQGHTTRMAEVLRMFMHARLAGILKGAEGVDYSRFRGAMLHERTRRLRELLQLTAEAREERQG